MPSGEKCLTSRVHMAVLHSSEAHTACAASGVADWRAWRYRTDLACHTRCVWTTGDGIAQLVECRSAAFQQIILVVGLHAERTCAGEGA